MNATSNAIESPLLNLDELPSPTGAKTLAILDLLSKHPEGLNSSEAVRRSGLTQNLVYRVLKTLVAMGYASQREDNKTYVLTNRLLELSGPRLGERSLTLCAHEALRQLRDQTGETVQLVMEAEGKVLVLEQFRGTHPLQVCGEVGMRVPMYSCAPGKAILASWNEAKLEEWFKTRGRPLKRFTSTTITRRETLERELEMSRAQGFAVDRAEGAEGIHCVAVALVDRYGQPVGSITTMAPAARMPESEFAAVAEKCAIAKAETERRLHA